MLASGDNMGGSTSSDDGDLNNNNNTDIGINAHRLITTVTKNAMSTWAADLMKRPTTNNTDGADPLLCTTLCPHQRDFVYWGQHRETVRSHCCLGGFVFDEPGLGKTLQMLALMSCRKTVSASHNNPTLIVMPSHLIDHWVGEIETHFNPGTFKYVRYYGINRHRLKIADDVDIIFTSYGSVRNDFVREPRNERGVPRCVPVEQHPDIYPGFRKDSIFGREFERLVFDESHNFRNSNATAAAVTYLRGRIVWCITATPIMNRVDDLLNQVTVLGIHPYANPLIWKAHISGPMAWRPITTFDRLMRDVIVPFSIRRRKDSIIGMPSRNETIRWLTFSAEEEQLYTLLLDYTRLRVERLLDNIRVLQEYHDRTTRFISRMRMCVSVFILRLRQACCHPQIVVQRILSAGGSDVYGGEGMGENALQTAIDLLGDAIDHGLDDECCICYDKKATFANGSCSHSICDRCADQMMKHAIYLCPLCRVTALEWKPIVYALDEMQTTVSNETIATAIMIDPLLSCKVRWVMEDLQAHDDKIVVVSQWVENLKIYSRLFDTNGIVHVWLDGSVPPNRRHVIVNKFQADPTVRVCLLSLSASSEGINLTSACRVYHLDPWWNESKATQASDRVHRIGQSKAVFITHLRVRGTIEEALETMQRQKAEVADVVVGKRPAENYMRWANNVGLMLGDREQDACRQLLRTTMHNGN